MAIILFSFPHLVAELLEPAEIDQNIILMDIYGIIDGDRWLADITVIFNPISFSRNHGQTRADFYLGCTEATIKLDLRPNGDFKNYTKASEITVGRTVEKTLTKGVKVALKPEVEIKPKIKASVGEISIEKNKENKLISTFETIEYTLQPLKAGKTVEWRIKSPKGMTAVRDFLYGNMVLSADIKWEKNNYVGAFTIRTADIRFFNDKGETLTWRQYIAMKFITRPKIKLQNRDGLTFNFEIYA